MFIFLRADDGLELGFWSVTWFTYLVDALEDCRTGIHPGLMTNQMIVKNCSIGIVADKRNKQLKSTVHRSGSLSI